MSYFGINGNVDQFFSGSVNSGSTYYGSALSDFASIQNGSYKKLLTAYFDKQKKGTLKETQEEKDSTVRKTAAAKADAQALSETAEALMKRGGKSVFSMKEMEKTDEKTGEKIKTKGYDRDAIKDSVKKFVNQYNALVDSGSELDNVNILRNTLNLTKMTKANAGILSDAGITIGDVSKLVLNEEKLLKASIKDLTNLFQGSGSYGSRVAEKASVIEKAASLENAKASGTYSNTGSYTKNLDTGKIYQSIL